MRKNIIFASFNSSGPENIILTSLKMIKATVTGKTVSFINPDIRRAYQDGVFTSWFTGEFISIGKLKSTTVIRNTAGSSRYKRDE